jgi:hypothetical protein
MASTWAFSARCAELPATRNEAGVPKPEHRAAKGVPISGRFCGSGSPASWPAGKASSSKNLFRNARRAQASLAARPPARPSPGFSGPWKLESGPRPAELRGLQRDGATVELGEIADDRETEP